MAANLVSRGRKGGLRRRAPMSEINVTPFVDVMLVLLIVFMVTAPLLTVGIPVDLPRTEAQNISEPVEPLVVTVNKEGSIFIQESGVEMEQLVPRLRAITENKPDTRIYIRGDRNLAYGRVMEVMGRLNTAGFTRVALISEVPSPGDEDAQ